MAEPGSKLIEVLLDRLYASLVSGPLMSCRPHASRQRVDWSAVAKLRGPTPSQALAALLGEARSVRFVAPGDTEAPPGANGKGEAKQDERKSLFTKFRAIAEDAQTYEEDTGSQALFVGFPLLHIPPDSGLGGSRLGKRILAPLALIPLTLTVKSARPSAVTFEAAGEGADLVQPNVALLAWVERVSGKKIGDLFADEDAADPWREINEIAAAVTQALDLPAPALGPELEVVPTPRSDAEDANTPGIVMSAVVGLFPAANQGLLSDLEALRDGERAVGPIESFLRAGTDLGSRRDQTSAETSTSLAGSERCVSLVDPCQARAVHLARRVNGLVIHGPPGTGKSQTITNVIGDHLANGERVLFVCDKRTAIDIVAYRLEHLGLGSLCAVVHDARRDQRELYRGLKDQLDNLPETAPLPGAVASLSATDGEIARIHRELNEFERALSERPGAGEPSFHELVGKWFAARVPPNVQVSCDLAGVSLHELVPLESLVKEVTERGLREAYATNSWRAVLQGDLASFLGQPYSRWQERLGRVAAAAERLDQLALPTSPPFADRGDARAEGSARRLLGDLVADALRKSAPKALAQWIATEDATVRAASAETAAAAPYVEMISRPVDRELALAVPAASLAVPEMMQWMAKLGSYLRIAEKWYGFLFFGRLRQARAVLTRFGLALGGEPAKRVLNFVERLRARKMLEAMAGQLGRAGTSASDTDLAHMVDEHASIFRVIAALNEDPGLRAQAPALRQALVELEARPQLLPELMKAEERGAALAELESALLDLGLLTESAQAAVSLGARRGNPVLPLVADWVEKLSTVEGLLRIRGLLAGTKPAVANLLQQLLERAIGPEVAWQAVRRAVYSAEISRRVQSAPILQSVDGDRVSAFHRRYRELNAQRRSLTRDLALHVWIARQRERLLASTGTRLNSAGAEIRRRLVTRGERAMRVRQMIAAGSAIQGGDPLFDLRPVWMASPDVVAQLFPREALFDVVIFDEASQCRLEEGLPVLLRAKRVVIAGDPQQLPPTRFFEAAVAQSTEQQADTEQGLFEAQQAEVEDLLGAALNLSVEQAYLDVHYRSNNADLIEFSNRNFYESRLQAIPAHPSSRTLLPPLRLIPVGGVYEDRTNLREAIEVVKVVKRLLSSDAPPSIGIACFNLDFARGPKRSCFG